MNNNIFRKSSIERVSSPEQLNDYIRVSNPSVWIVLAAIIILLASALVWGIFGSLPTQIKASGIADDGKIVCYLSGDDVAKVFIGATVKVDRVESSVTSISATPISYEEANTLYTDAYTLYALNLGEWNYAVTIEAKGISNGITSLSIVVDSVKPISFILN